MNLSNFACGKNEDHTLLTYSCLFRGTTYFTDGPDHALRNDYKQEQLESLLALITQFFVFLFVMKKIIMIWISLTLTKIFCV